MSPPKRDRSRAFTGGLGLIVGAFVLWLGGATLSRGAQAWGAALGGMGVYFTFSGGKALAEALRGPPPAQDAPLTRLDRLQALLGALSSLGMAAAAALAESKLSGAERMAVAVLFGLWGLLNAASLFAR